MLLNPIWEWRVDKNQNSNLFKIVVYVSCVSISQPYKFELDKNLTNFKYGAERLPLGGQWWISFRILLENNYRILTLSGKTLLGETIRRAKLSSPNEKFVTFARQKISPNKSKIVFKWSTSEPTREASHLDKFWLPCWEKLCWAKLHIWWNFRHF